MLEVVPALELSSDCCRKANELTKRRGNRGRRPSLCLAIPALTASLGSIADTLNYNWDCDCADEFPVEVEDLEVGKVRFTILEGIGFMMEHNFGWKAFWNWKLDWSCLQLNLRLAVKFRQSREVAMPGKSVGSAPSLRVIPWDLP